MVHFLDTSVLLYTISDSLDEADKKAQACKLVESRGCVISLQCLSEFCSRAIKGKTRNNKVFQQPRNREVVFGIAAEWMRRMTLVSPSKATFHSAQQICSQYQLQFHDSHLLAAALEQKCSIFYCEDLQDGLIIGEMKVVNPFKA
jgi:predicted nucleic acid-binding protein